MDNFEHHLYLYYFNSLNSSPKIQMKFKYISADTVQVNNFLHTRFVHNFVRRHEEYKCWFECQDLWKPIWTYKLYPNLNLYPFLNQILSVFHFSWLLGCVLSIYEKIISFKGKHVDKMIIFYKNGGGGGFRRTLSATEDILTPFYWGMKSYKRNTHQWDFHLYILVYFIYFYRFAINYMNFTSRISTWE